MSEAKGVSFLSASWRASIALAINPDRAHIPAMVKAAEIPKKLVRLSNGEMVEVRGYGALKGKLKLMPGIDLTKPIYEQVIRKTPRASALKR